MYKGTVTADLHICEKFDIVQITRLLTKIALHANTTDELIILGDIFHNSKASPLELLTFINFLKQVTVPIVLIAGNHDTLGDNSLIDWVPQVLPIMASKESLIIKREELDILLAHYNVEESVMGSYDFKLKSGLSVDQLNVPLALLGHIHKSQHIQGEKTQAVHPGSIFYIDYNERNDTKGFIELTIEGSSYKIEHISLDPDPIMQFETTPEGVDSIIAGIIKDLDLKTCIKVVIKYEDPNLNKREVLKKFDKWHFKEKKFSFIYDSPNSIGNNSVVTEDNKLVELEEYLTANSSTEVISLIKVYLKKG
jgi:DNA repair exonuclease SbcCD nuclease subunit